MGYRSRFEYQWGCRCRDITLGARPQAGIKFSALIVHPEPTDCHVSLWPGENGGLLPACQTGVSGAIEEGGMWQSSRPASFSPAGLTLWPSWLERWLATLSGLSVQVRIPVGLSVSGHYTYLTHCRVTKRQHNILVWLNYGMITIMYNYDYDSVILIIITVITEIWCEMVLIKVMLIRHFGNNFNRSVIYGNKHKVNIISYIRLKNKTKKTSYIWLITS